MKIITYSISYFLSSVCPFCPHPPSFPYVIFYLLPWIFPPTSQAFTLRSQPKSLLFFVSSLLHPLWESVSKWIDWAKSVACREREGESGWGARERQRNGHELFMNVSMKGSKNKGGGGTKEMAAATDFTHLQGTPLPKSSFSPPGCPPSLILSSWLLFSPVLLLLCR